MVNPAKRRRKEGPNQPQLPKVVEEALSDPAICHTTEGGACSVGLRGPFRTPPQDPPANHLEALKRSPQSLQVGQGDLDLLLKVEEVPRLLTPSSPRRPYRRRQDDLKSTIHWGQRKLLLSEVEFLTRYSAGCDRVIYAGAAPGVHIAFLRQLFPALSFVLVDPGDFSVEGTEDGGIVVKNEFFTKELAETLKKEGSPSTTLFISDVRTADSKHHTFQEVDALVAKDMAMQKEWVETLMPKQAMLKFRLPYAEGSTEYFEGDLFLPVWGTATTTELRLVCPGDGEEVGEEVGEDPPKAKKKPMKKAAKKAAAAPTKFTLKEYSHREIEEQMFYFNTVTRVQLFKTPLVGQGLCESYDSAAELSILQGYLASLTDTDRSKLEAMLGAPTGSGEASAPSSKQLSKAWRAVPKELLALAMLTKRVSQECSGRERHLLTEVPSNWREKWFSAKVFDAKSGSYLDAASEPGKKLLAQQKKSSASASASTSANAS